MSRLLDVADLPDYSGHPNSPHADDWDDGLYVEPAPTLSRRELVDLAGRGDTAALAVIDAAIACNGEWSLIEEASDEELADWYADAQKAEAIAARAIVSHDCPPIPTTAFDWSAVLPGYDGGDPIGRGPTRDAAIADLAEKVSA